MIPGFGIEPPLLSSPFSAARKRKFRLCAFHIPRGLHHRRRHRERERESGMHDGDGPFLFVDFMEGGSTAVSLSLETKNVLALLLLQAFCI